MEPAQELTNERPLIPDVLAHRYASRAMLDIWSPRGRVLQERRLWVAVMRAQRTLGVDIPPEAVAAYEGVLEQIDLDSIERRERASRHDVKAKIEEFNALAGHEHIHKGMTSRDLTDNVEQLQMRQGMALLHGKTAAALVQLAKRAEEYATTPLVARTHHVPAQPTTLGKRLAMFGEGLLRAYTALGQTLQSYPLRGIKGAVGTRLDQLSLMGGRAGDVDRLEQAIASELGFASVLGAVGQVYPRSLDFEVLSAMYQVGAPLSDFARTMRLMTGHELASEGFAEGQVGSSAMPHKMNARSSERINGFQSILAGFLEMAGRLAGDQWNEGDVSCSVVRRVALPGAMFALDGALETFITIMDEMKAFEPMMAQEMQRVLPFVASTTLMMEAVKAGGGREEMHHIIREHSVAVAMGLRDGTVQENDLARRLGQDAGFPLDTAAIEAVLADPARFNGDAPAQTADFAARARQATAEYPQAASYRPDPIL